ncbi:methyltransferase-like protein 2-A [Biomphalaria pfeifferi]|uniref:tRNA N(3)-methylcytidine methyltransferase n=1 Tax=Biomphalaria pfeifferi TaxID=112525 RepID=A0AAD8CCG8_BIOPF|nr:methyltransferase-like protein 2-A [Biomphalaria pfeifferi]
MAEIEKMSELIRDNASQEQEDKRTKFGTRFLTDPDSVFKHNAWDNVEWDEEQETAAKQIAMKHADHKASQDKLDELERDAVKHWDEFYSVHNNHFFKDRQWLFTEFHELHGAAQECSSDMKLQQNISCTQTKLEEQNADQNLLSDSTFKLLEVGCGVGNTVFPILKTNKNPNLKVYCCDFSSTAVDIVKSHPDYDTKRCHAFVYDITDEQAAVPIEKESLDVIIMIFVLSAISPEKMSEAIKRLACYLKLGGMFLFRDYGRYDMAQLRFKENRCLSENFYVRGDGTRVYFFTQDELKDMFEKAGLKEKEIVVDRRLQVNRVRQLKMFRVWIQCKFCKPVGSE